ncbi:hypothetical protein J7384_04535 [Endozoicomonas sp. G2_1]|uniref:tetratricopeptide repeat protein n=1 Tax=Endozoicomonas sp. G2_1 TaxID=2821091 RepID=UPI001ADB32F1|nr:tetratricopeptide repeat protein [Endozoicomonas sp. G2_1]MBO9489625.1 hypothetical protein [Endozoicomonas sp. G2_1]
MSVINQMLKDLDERKPQTVAGQEQAPVYQASVKSSTKPIIIAVLITVVCAFVAFSLWQMDQQNKQLTEQLAQTQQVPMQTETTSVSSPELESKKLAQTPPPSAQPVVESNQIEPKAEPVDVVTSSNEYKVEMAEQAPEQISNNEQISNTRPVERKIDGEAEVMAQETSEANTPVVEQTAKPNATMSKTAEPKATMSIARRQLSAPELAEQKFKQAEQALLLNQVQKAESLFEEVLLLTPQNNLARQQLAALWFGRQDYQAAVNLLQQGISQAPNNIEFRLMQARIFQRQGNFRAAYDVLIEKAQTPNVDYQALLANAAQQSQQFNAAIEAYQFLMQAQPQQAKWLLGLAVAYDSDSQFEQALLAYKQAVQQGGLSATTLNFAKQRLQELGE